MICNWRRAMVEDTFGLHASFGSIGLQILEGWIIAGPRQQPGERTYAWYSCKECGSSTKEWR